MRLRRLRLAHFRGIQTCDIELLAPGRDRGVTVIEGPNEAGKSSLADAVRLLFDYPHSSRHRDVRSLQPAGLDVPTTIELTLDHGELRVTYAKTFNRDVAATLTVRGARNIDLTGKEAHEHAGALLREMVDTALWRTLHVRQGVVAQAELADATSLLAALQGGGSAVAGTASGQRAPGGALVDDHDAVVTAHVLGEYGRWRTDTGRDRKPLTDLSATVEALTAERDAAQAVVDALAADLEEIARLQGSIPEERAHVTRCSTELADLEEQLVAVQRLEHEVARHDETVAAATARVDRAMQAWQRRCDLVEAVRAAVERRAAADDSDTDDAVVDVTTRLDAARAHLAAAETDVDRHRGLAAECRHREKLLEACRELTVLQERRERIQALATRIGVLDARIGAATVDETTIAGLRAAQAAVAEAEAARTASAASVRVTALTPFELAYGDDDSRTLAAGASADIDLDGRRPLTIGAIARVDVAPGEALATLAAAALAASDELASRLRACGMDTITAAERAYAAVVEDTRRRSDAVAERAALLALEPYTDLDARLTAVAARLDELRPAVPHVEAPQAASDVPPIDEVTDEVLDAARMARRTADEGLEDAQRRYRAAVAAVEELRDVREQLQERAEHHRVELRVAEQTHAEVTAQLTHERTATSDEALERSLHQREEEVRVATAARSAAARRLEGAHVEAIVELRDAARAAVTTGTQRLADDERRLAALQAAVATRSADGPVTRRDRAQVKLEQAQQRRAQCRARADAAALAVEVLERHRLERRRRYLAPLREEIERLGRLLWGPTLAVELDDDLRIRTRILAGRALDYDQLSLGAQEQLALIGRLACAIVVGPGGAPLIIDDALGFSDPDKLRRMGAVLSVAGRSSQIILLTCHPQRYVHVAGATTVRMRGSGPPTRQGAAA